MLYQLISKYKTDIYNNKESKNNINPLSLKLHMDMMKFLLIYLKYAQFILVHLCNMSLSSEIFPQCLKYCAVKPLYKKGERNCTYNYRPVTIMKSSLKVFEKAMYNKLLGHLNDSNILVEEQFGFRKNLATEKATYELNNEIVSALSKKLIVGWIFCDLAKVFDCVNHYILLSKLNFYGITGKVYE